MTGTVMMVIVTLVFIAVVLPVGLSLWQSITGSFSQSSWTAAANTTKTTLDTNIGNGLNLMAISPIIVAAAGVIGLLVYGFVKMRNGGV